MTMKLLVAVCAALAVPVGLAPPARADYYAYIDQLEANGLLVYERPPRCTPRPQMDALCPQVDRFYSQDGAARVGGVICDIIQRGGTKADAIEYLTVGEGIKFTDQAASAIYNIAVTSYCWQ